MCWHIVIYWSRSVHHQPHAPCVDALSSRSVYHQLHAPRVDTLSSTDLGLYITSPMLHVLTHYHLLIKVCTSPAAYSMCWHMYHLDLYITSRVHHVLTHYHVGLYSTGFVLTPVYDLYIYVTGCVVTCMIHVSTSLLVCYNMTQVSMLWSKSVCSDMICASMSPVASYDMICVSMLWHNVSMSLVACYVMIHVSTSLNACWHDPCQYITGCMLIWSLPVLST